MRKFMFCALCVGVVLTALAAPASANVRTGLHPTDPMPPLPPKPVVVATIDKSQQRMRVTVNGKKVYNWRVSTARRGYITPSGQWKPTRIHRMWYSRKYQMSPMPYSVFYHRGYAIHGTNYVKQLGRPASHGCVRLHPSNAKKFYQLVARYGMGRTRVVVTR